MKERTPYKATSKLGAVHRKVDEDGDAIAEAAGVTKYPKTMERIARRELIFQLLNSGADNEMIRRACAEQFRMTPGVTDQWITRLKNERCDAFEADRPRYKSEQAARLRADLVRMRASKVKNWSAITRHEALLARIVGTFEPVTTTTNVNVNVRASLQSVIANLDTSALDDMVAEEMALMADAANGRLLTARSTVVDTTGERVEVPVEGKRTLS